MGLSPKQFAFVREYLIDLNATQAAIRAGYSAKTAHSQGPRLLENVGVQAAIEKAQAKLTAKAEITVEEILCGMRDEARGLGEDTNSSSRVAAWAWLGKYRKLWVEKHEISGSLETLTDEQLKARAIEAAARLAEQLSGGAGTTAEVAASESKGDDDASLGPEGDAL